MSAPRMISFQAGAVLFLIVTVTALVLVARAALAPEPHAQAL